MTNGQNIAQEPVPGAPQKKKGGALKWVFIGGCDCLVVFGIIIALIVGAAVMGVQKFKSTIDPTLSAQTQALIDGDIQTAYSYCSSAFKANTDLQNFEAFVNAHKPVLTSPDRNFTSFNLQNNLLTMEGTVTTAQGKVYSVTYKFVKEGDKWLIHSINLNN